MDEQEKQRIIAEYLQRKNQPEQEFDSEVSASNEDSQRKALEEQAAYEPSLLAKAMTGMAAGFGGRSGSEAVQGLYKDQRAAKEQLAKMNAEAPERAWQAEQRGRQRSQWAQQDASSQSADDPTSEESRAAQALAARLGVFKGRDLANIPASKLQSLLGPAMDIEKLEQGRIKAAQANTAQGPKLTPAETAVDKAFAKTYEDYVLSGSSSGQLKKGKQLNEALNNLETDNTLTGPIRGMAPDWLRSITNPKAIETKEAIQEVVQGNLRDTLGPQFTEKEGDRLIARAYNDRLSPEENIRRVKRLIEQIKLAGQAKEAAARYYEQNGTMKGFTGKIYQSADDFDLGDEWSGSAGTSPSKKQPLNADDLPEI